MFDNLPFHIKEMIFFRVRYIDLFETVRVSQEWWALTMASYERLIHKADDFLLDQVEFCNQMMPREEPWEWWMLMEFTKSKRLHLEREHFNPLLSGPEPRLVDYYKGIGIAVRHLILDSYVIKDRFCRYRRCPPNLNELFPDLISLKLFYAKFDDGMSLVLPRKLQHVILSRVLFKQAANLSDIFPDPGMVKILEIGADDTPHIVFDSVKFDNLTHLSLNVSNLSPFNLTKATPILKRLIRDCKSLRSVALEKGLVTKDWLKILPSNIVEVDYSCPLLNLEIQNVFGKDVLYDRLLLMYICEDWKKVEKFKTERLSLYTTEYEIDENGILDFGRSPIYPYYVQYVCRPTRNEEEIMIEPRHFNTDINQLISNNEGLVLTILDCKVLYKKSTYAVSVPRTVRDCSFNIDYRVGFSLEDKFEVLNVVRKLNVYKEYSHVKGNLSGFPRMVNLVELEIITCDSHSLACILEYCTSLVQLTLNEQESGVFASISTDVKAKSLKVLKIFGGDDTVDNIMKPFPCLQSLTLHGISNEALLKSNLTTASDLYFFKVVTTRNNNVALNFTKLEFPYMMFACCRFSDYFAMCKVRKLIDEISDVASENNLKDKVESFVLAKGYYAYDVSIVYVKNISVRFLRNSYLVVLSIAEFVQKVQVLTED